MPVWPACRARQIALVATTGWRYADPPMLTEPTPVSTMKAMWTAVVAAAAAILGVAVGRLWDSRAESSRWHRDQTVASYQRLAEAFRTSYDNIQAIAFADPNARDFSAMVRKVIVEGNRVWHDALSSVWFHGSPGVIAAATTLDRSLTGLHAQAAGRLFSAEDWARARVPARRAFEEFLEAARVELALPPVPDSFYDDTHPAPDPSLPERGRPGLASCRLQVPPSGRTAVPPAMAGRASAIRQHAANGLLQLTNLANWYYFLLSTFAAAIYLAGSSPRG